MNKQTSKQTNKHTILKQIYDIILVIWTTVFGNCSIASDLRCFFRLIDLFLVQWSVTELNCHVRGVFNPKRAWLFGPISQPGGGGHPAPKISETDWRNIKCVVLVDSYDPPESIGTKKRQTYLVWRHSDIISDIMSKTRKHQESPKSWFFAIFSSKSCIFWQRCMSKYAYTCSYSK